jgi:FkbM family methyltransferase
MNLKTVLSNGAIVYGKNKKGYGGRGIYIYGEDIEPELKHLDKFLEKDSVFIDIGANTGIYCLKAAKHLNKGGVVIAIEPFIEILRTLANSVRNNGFQNIRLRNFCAVDKTGERILWLNSNLPNTFSVVERMKSSSGVSVMGVSIDDLMKWENLNRLDYLKIDAEGAEEEILKGAKETINKFRPIIQVETIVRDVKVNFNSYRIYQAPKSINVVMFPEESKKIKSAEELGWKRLE